MDSFQFNNTSPPLRDRLRTWRQLPRILVSRRWRWLTLIVLVIGAGSISLGFWQLDRRQQRLERNALIKQRFENQPPIALTGQALDINEVEYRRVTISGEFDPSNEVILRNRAREGTPGVDVLTPLRITGTDHYVLVDRGWIPLFQSGQEQRQEFAVRGPVTIEGVIRRPQTGRSWGPQQDRIPQGGRLDAWFWPNVPLIASQMPYPLVETFYVEQLPSEGAPDLPHPQVRIDYQSEGSHWSYAIQWFSFATILLGGYAAFVVTKTEQAETGDRAR